jgi:hypothetical protein
MVYITYLRYLARCVGCFLERSGAAVDFLLVCTQVICSLENSRGNMYIFPLQGLGGFLQPSITRFSHVNEDKDKD